MGLTNYIKESYNELTNHVTWPTWAESQKWMVVVAVFSILFSIAIWGTDTILSRAITGLYNLLA